MTFAEATIMKKVIKGGDAVKTYSSRTNATAPLRKLGIKASDYNLFVFQTTDGRYAVALDKAEEYLAARLRKVATEEVPQQQNKGRTLKEAESNQIKRPTVAGVIRKMILDGHDNKSIHEVMKRDFNHDEDKAHYPGWYRSQMRREGLVERPAARVKKEKPVKAPKPAKEPKAPQVKKSKKSKAAKPVKAKTPNRAQANIKATIDAGMKTGNKDEHVGPLSIVQVK